MNLWPFQPQDFKKHFKKMYAWQCLKLNIKICWFFDNSQVSLNTYGLFKKTNKQTNKQRKMRIWNFCDAAT